METHGSESYFVIGEGLLSEAIGGRDQDGTARVASATATAADAVPPFRFSRMGPNGAGKQVSEAVALKVGREMAAGGGGSGPIPAGFTYLGQFIDHDLTFDKTQVMLGQNVSPAQMLQARSPALDLDSLYGAGPGDPESAKFYSDDRHLKMGKTAAQGGFPGKNGFDLPRGEGNTNAKKRKAVIPDPRNDENLAVAQTHLAMIRFHNRIVDTHPELGAGRAALREGARARGQALPVDDQDGLPAEDLPAGAHQRRLQQQGARCSRRTRPRPPCRLCRSSSPWPASGSATR